MAYSSLSPVCFVVSLSGRLCGSCPPISGRSALATTWMKQSGGQMAERTDFPARCHHTPYYNSIIPAADLPDDWKPEPKEKEKDDENQIQKA